MALADYRLCDVCGGKAFYDSNLNYADGRDEWKKDDPPFRIAGDEQYENPEHNAKWGMRLDYVGDWAVLCSGCAKNFKTAIVAKENGAQGVESDGGETD